MREKPADPARHYLLGLCLLELGQFADGRQSMKRAISLAPRHGPAHFALGKLASQENDVTTAERHLRTAIRCEPDLLPAYVELGNLHVANQQYDEALGVLRHALERRQDHPGLQANYGNVLYQTGNRPAAIEAWRAALKLDPNMATAHASLGLALRATGAWEEAIAALERAVALEPKVGEHRFNLALTYYQRRRYREAKDALIAAEPLMAESRRVRIQRARACQAMCDWDGLDAMMADIETEVAAAHAGESCFLTAFASLSLPLDQESRSAIARRQARDVVDHARRLRRAGTFEHPGSAIRSDRRTRLGYISTDFRDHAIGHLVAGIFALHDRERFDIFGYSIGPDDGSPWRKRIEAGIGELVDLQTLGDAAAAARIHADAIDILIDLNGLTALSRPEILAMRPAAVQATWTGTPGTTGAPFFDYVLTDPVVTPPDMQRHYAEQFCYLPGCYHPYDRDTAVVPGRVSRAAEGLPDDAMVLACFCAHYKIDRTSFGSWCATLRAVPDAVLWLLGESPEGEAILRAAAATNGIDARRLIFARRKPRDAHMARLGLADLALDTFIYGAHTTAADALRAGVPMITRLGPEFAARVAASMLIGIGLPELVARDIAGCVALTTELAADRTKLARLRTKLAGLIPTAANFDTAALVSGLEKACEAMWAQHRSGNPPAPIDLAEPPYVARVPDAR